MLSLVSLASCGTQTGDLGTKGVIPPPSGPDKRIHDVTAPDSPDKAENLQSVSVSGAVVIAVDDFDETSDGRSKGTIYVQDLSTRDDAGKPIPYAGISLFAPSFIPGNLKVGIGDVLDLQGTYQENQSIGSATFAPGALLPQIAQPLSSFRFEVARPEPIEIDLADLGTYESARRWLGMLVKVRNVTLLEDVTRDNTASNGRQSVNLLPRDPEAVNACEAPFPKPPELVNELADLPALNLPEGTVVKSITGIVSYFCTIHLAPRSLEDVEL